MEHFNGLTSAEDERLAILLEECGEAIQVIGKINRHGYNNFDPTKLSPPTNRQMLEKELADISVAMKMMIEACDLSAEAIAFHESVKRESIKPYLHHQ